MRWQGPRQGQAQSLTARAWAVALSVLGLAIVADLAWALIRPLLPVLFAIAVVAAGLATWNQRRWR